MAPSRHRPPDTGEVTAPCTRPARRRRCRGPTDAFRESDGSTLIADAAADRVIRVVADSQHVSWQYPEAGSGDGLLNDPMGVGVEQGDVMIADTGDHRVIEVDEGDAVVWSSASVETSAPALDDPRLADRVSGSPADDVLGSPETVDGALLVCDQGARNLALIGDPGGAQAVTRTFTVTRSGQQAHLIRLTLHASTPRPTGASMYSTPSSGQTSDESYGVGAHWGRGVITTKISFFITLTTTDLWLTPMVKDIVLTYTIGATKAKTSGNGGATVGNGTASGTGTGAGSGVGGSGNGSGVGAGQGTSPDLGGSGTAGTPGSTAKSGANVVVPAGAQVATTGGAAAEGTITGVPLNVGNLSGGALGGGGGSPPPHVSNLAADLRVAGAAAFVGCLLICPPLVAQRRLRRLTGHEPTDVVDAWVVEATPPRWSPKGDSRGGRGRRASWRRSNATERPARR